MSTGTVTTAKANRPTVQLFQEQSLLPFGQEHI